MTYYLQKKTFMKLKLHFENIKNTLYNEKNILNLTS